MGSLTNTVAPSPAARVSGRCSWRGLGGGVSSEKGSGCRLIPNPACRVTVELLRCFSPSFSQPGWKQPRSYHAVRPDGRCGGQAWAWAVLTAKSCPVSSLSPGCPCSQPAAPAPCLPFGFTWRCARGASIEDIDSKMTGIFVLTNKCCFQYVKSNLKKKRGLFAVYSPRSPRHV